MMGTWLLRLRLLSALIGVAAGIYLGMFHPSRRQAFLNVISGILLGLTLWAMRHQKRSES